MTCPRAHMTQACESLVARVPSTIGRSRDSPAGLPGRQRRRRGTRSRAEAGRFAAALSPSRAGPLLGVPPYPLVKERVGPNNSALRPKAHLAFVARARPETVRAMAKREIEATSRVVGYRGSRARAAPQRMRACRATRRARTRRAGRRAGRGAVAAGGRCRAVAMAAASRAAGAARAPGRTTPATQRGEGAP